MKLELVMHVEPAANSTGVVFGLSCSHLPFLCPCLRPSPCPPPCPCLCPSPLPTPAPKLRPRPCPSPCLGPSHSIRWAEDRLAFRPGPCQCLRPSLCCGPSTSSRWYQLLASCICSWPQPWLPPPTVLTTPPLFSCRVLFGGARFLICHVSKRQVSKHSWIHTPCTGGGGGGTSNRLGQQRLIGAHRVGPAVGCTRVEQGRRAGFRMAWDRSNSNNNSNNNSNKQMPMGTRVGPPGSVLPWVCRYPPKVALYQAFSRGLGFRV